MCRPPRGGIAGAVRAVSFDEWDRAFSRRSSSRRSFSARWPFGRRRAHSRRRLRVRLPRRRARAASVPGYRTPRGFPPACRGSTRSGTDRAGIPPFAPASARPRPSRTTTPARWAGYAGAWARSPTSARGGLSRVRIASRHSAVTAQRARPRRDGLATTASRCSRPITSGQAWSRGSSSPFRRRRPPGTTGFISVRSSKVRRGLKTSGSSGSSRSSIPTARGPRHRRPVLATTTRACRPSVAPSTSTSSRSGSRPSP